MGMQERPFYELLEFINIHMFSYQIGCLRSICEYGGEFSERAILLAIYLEFTFTFMHLADAFIQSDLHLHSGYTFSLVSVFPGNRTHNLLRC